jgi:8-oxo-dGTP diphosphatase
MENKINIGVVIIIKNDRGEILFCQRKKEFGFGEWELPGGHLEFQETFERCVERECMEELGIVVKASKLISVAPNMKYGNHYVIFTFVTDAYEGQIKNKEPEIHSEIKWFSEKELPKPLFVASKNALDSYFSGEIYKPQT